MESSSPLLSPADSLAITHARSWSVAAHGLGTWSHSVHIQPAFPSHPRGASLMAQ